jgi:arylsulfatase A-like enzyme
VRLSAEPGASGHRPARLPATRRTDALGSRRANRSITPAQNAAVKTIAGHPGIITQVKTTDVAGLPAPATARVLASAATASAGHATPASLALLAADAPPDGSAPRSPEASGQRHRRKVGARTRTRAKAGFPGPFAEPTIRFTRSSRAHEPTDQIGGSRLMAAFAAMQGGPMAHSDAAHERAVLPVPHRTYPGFVTYDAKDPDTSFPPLGRPRPPAGAPNVLVVLLDDVGFGASSAFGGPIRMPTAERLAANGIRYNRFHTTAMCSPTRAALLTGRNHHTAGMGGITELATASPGYSSVIPNTCAPIAQTLKLNGYSTAQFGKCHEIPVWECSPQGPFDSWPTGGGGFEYFYGFLGGDTNQYSPALYENTVAVEPGKTPEQGYHFMADMTDRAIGWVEVQRALVPDKPFFLYFAPGVAHTPHHVPKEWADRYAGEFDQGWDRVREETLARQKALGVVPQDCELTARPDVITAWDDMDDELKPVLARQMEVYAGFLEFADHHLGRLIDALDRLRVLDSTLVYYIIGDNGASAEGSMRGTSNEYLAFNLRNDLDTNEYLISKLDELGSPSCANHYSSGWAHAMDTPFQWTKQIASHWGGTRNATVVHWPAGIAAKGEIRTQFCHVIDVAPTILEAARLPAPTQVNGVLQEPMHGASMVYSFDDKDAPERHDSQYFELMGNRGIYHKGWSAVTLHRHPIPGRPRAEQVFDDDTWELYDGATDFSQAHNLAAEQPERLRELKRLFLIQAARFNVLPLDDRRAERVNPELLGPHARPFLIRGNTQTLYGQMRRLTESCVLNLKNKSFSITAEIEIPPGGGHGTIVAQGGAFGGWSLYAKDNALRFCYNFLGFHRYTTSAQRPLPEGTYQVRAEFAYDGEGIGRGGDVTLYLHGEPVGKGRVEETQPILFSQDETTDVGEESGTPVSDQYRLPETKFTGAVNWVRLEAGLDGSDHLIDPRDLIDVAMARQ